MKLSEVVSTHNAASSVSEYKKKTLIPSVSSLATNEYVVLNNNFLLL